MIKRVASQEVFKRKRSDRYPCSYHTPKSQFPGGQLSVKGDVSGIRRHLLLRLLDRRADLDGGWVRAHKLAAVPGDVVIDADCQRL